jgi:diguanylate cyclase (GGDEF)-like protein
MKNNQTAHHIKNKLTSNKQRLMLLLMLIISAGFLLTTLQSYFTSVKTVRKTIVESELPLTSDNIFSAIRRDLIEPTLVSSMIANDTFLHDWSIGGEKNIIEITKYLSQIKERYHATTSFFVSEQSRNYYYIGGVLKKISIADPHDDWYFDAKKSPKLYEIDVDTDQAHQNKLTIFINYKVLSHDQNFLGLAGIGLTVDGVSKTIDRYQQQFQRTIYFVNRHGDVMLTGNHFDNSIKNIKEVPALKSLANDIFSNKKEMFEYTKQDTDLLLSVRYLPELDWYVFVEKNVNNAILDLRHTLYSNLAICTLSIFLVSWLMRKIVNYYHRELEEIAVSDSLTGLPNRMYLELVAKVAISESKRKSEALSLIMIDMDHFKTVNDQFGHLAGDEVLRKLSATMKGCLRESDFICRWGGEEFVILLKGCDKTDAKSMAEKIRLAVEDAEVKYASHQITLTVSLGVSQWHEDEQFEQLINRADMALMKAKEMGRNRTVVA